MTQQGSDKLSQPLYNDCVNMTCSDDDKNILEIHAHNSTHNKKYHIGIRGIYITNTSTTMVFANEKTRSTTITVPRLLLPFP